MKKHHLLFLLGLIASAAPHSVGAKGTYRNTVKQKKTKSLRAHKTAYLRNGAIVAGVVLVGGLAAVCYRNRKEEKTNPEKDPTKKKEHLSGNLFAYDTALMCVVKKYVDQQDKDQWKTWILAENERIKGMVRGIIQTNGIDIGLQNTGGGNSEIARIEHGGIAEDNVVPLEMAVILAQLLHILQEDKKEWSEVYKVVEANNNRFLANLVIRHGDNAQKVDAVQTDGHRRANCIPAIFVLLNLGAANPDDTPKFGQSDNSPFKDGDKDIIEVAKAKGEGKAINIKETDALPNCTWDVKPIIKKAKEKKE